MLAAMGLVIVLAWFLLRQSHVIKVTLDEQPRSDFKELAEAVLIGCLMCSRFSSLVAMSCTVTVTFTIFIYVFCTVGFRYVYKR